MKRSVHLESFPDTKKFNLEQSLLQEMNCVKQICNSVLSLRKDKCIKVRIPLREVIIYSEKDLSLNQELINIIKDEVNAKNILISRDVSGFASEKLTLNLSVCGKKYGKNLRAMMSKANNGEYVKKDDKFYIDDIELQDGEYEVEMSGGKEDTNRPIHQVKGTDIFIEADISTSKELEQEGLLRGIIRNIQQCRKDIGLPMSQHIKISFLSEDSELIEVVKNKEMLEYLCSQVLSTLEDVSIVESDNSLVGEVFKLDIDGSSLTIAIIKK